MRNFLRYLLMASAIVVLLIGIFLPDTFSIIKKSEEEEEEEEEVKQASDIPYANEVK